MIFTRRAFVQLSLGSAFATNAMRLLAQGVATHIAKPVPRPAPSGRPFHAHFVDVASAAGLGAPVVYGGVESKKYILDVRFSITTMTAGWISFCFRGRASMAIPLTPRTASIEIIAMAPSRT